MVGGRSSPRSRAIRSISTRVDLPVPRPPIRALNQGLKASSSGLERPTTRASLTVIDSKARATGAFGSAPSTCSQTERSPSVKASRNPSWLGLVILIQVERRPISSSAWASEKRTRLSPGARRPRPMPRSSSWRLVSVVTISAAMRCGEMSTRPRFALSPMPTRRLALHELCSVGIASACGAMHSAPCSSAASARQSR